MTYRPPKTKVKKMTTAHRSALPNLPDTAWIRVEEMASECGLSPIEIVTDMVRHCVEPKVKKPRQNAKAEA